eukprot:581488-Alexandrium_andersonii.AAC.1
MALAGPNAGGRPPPHATAQLGTGHRLASPRVTVRATEARSWSPKSKGRPSAAQPPGAVAAPLHTQPPRAA